MNGALVNPQLKLLNAAGAQINHNDDWGGSAALSTAFTQTGAFTLPASSRDTALLLQVPPGTYTAQVSGVGNAIGVALVEVHDMQ